MIVRVCDILLFMVVTSTEILSVNSDVSIVSIVFKCEEHLLKNVDYESYYVAP